jgi:HSP20 family protein
MTFKNLFPARRRSVPVRREENPFEALRREMDTLLDDFTRGFFDIEPFEGAPGGRLDAFSPRVDVTENDKEITVSAELPGMDEKDMEVTLDKDSLTIKGKKEEEKEDKGKDYYHMERSYGAFARTVPLPAEVDTGKAEAAFRKGVLNIRLPKTTRAMEEKKKISVKVE